MKTIEVEGYEVTITKDEGKFIVSVPKLPGCTVQVEKEGDAPREIRAMIGLYMLELASKRPKGPKKDDDGDPAGRKKMTKVKK
jgi:predicted RNase H-like HicB family nuclease